MFLVLVKIIIYFNVYLYFIYLYIILIFYVYYKLCKNIEIILIMFYISGGFDILFLNIRRLFLVLILEIIYLR